MTRRINGHLQKTAQDYCAEKQKTGSAWTHSRRKVDRYKLGIATKINNNQTKVKV